MQTERQMHLSDDLMTNLDALLSSEVGYQYITKIQMSVGLHIPMAATI